MIRRGGLLAAVVVALFASPGPAWGAPDVPGAPPGPIRVALLSTTVDDPLAGRLDAELRTIGIDVSRAVVSPAVGIEEQVRSELTGGARAVIVADGHRTDVWIAEPGSDRVGLRQDLEVDQTSGREAVLALRTVEFLRISLGLVSGPTVEPLAATPVVVRTMPPAPPPGRWTTVDATAGALAVGGGGGRIAIAGIAVRAQLAGMVGAELCVYAPLTEAVLEGPDGQARTSVWMAGGGVLFAPRTERRMSVEIGAGALAVVIHTTGVPSAPVPSGTDVQVRGAIYGRGAARLRLAPRLSLRIDLFGGAVVNPPPFVFNETEVATWGPAFAAGLGGAELRF